MVLNYLEVLCLVNPGNEPKPHIAATKVSPAAKGKKYINSSVAHSSRPNEITTIAFLASDGLDESSPDMIQSKRAIKNKAMLQL